MPIPKLDFTDEVATVTMIVVRRDGSTVDGRKPLTFGLDLGGEYAERA